VPFEGYKDAFALMQSGDAAKIVLDLGEIAHVNGSLS
jgi:hypothetical protein